MNCEVRNWLVCVCLFGLCLSLGHGQDLSVSFKNPEPRFFSVGEKDQTFACQINRPLVFLFDNPFFIIHENLSGHETVLFERTSRKEANPSYYDLKRTEENGGNTFELKIYTVREEDEGSLICRVVPDTNHNDVLAEASVDINIKRKIESVYLKFSEMQEHSSYILHPGSYNVTCTTIGSSPSVKLYLDKKSVGRRIDTVERLASENHFGVIFTFEVNIDEENSGQKLECVAEQPFQVSEDEERMISSKPAKLEVFVWRIESVHLEFSEMPENSTYTVDPGSYKVTCTAMDSNPAVTNLRLYLDDEPVDGKIDIVQSVASENLFDTILTAEVNIDEENSGQKLECVAEQPFQVTEDGEQVNSSKPATLEVNPFPERDDDGDDDDADTGPTIAIVAVSVLVTILAVSVVLGVWYFRRQRRDGSLGNKTESQPMQNAPETVAKQDAEQDNNERSASHELMHGME